MPTTLSSLVAEFRSQGADKLIQDIQKVSSAEQRAAALSKRQNQVAQQNMRDYAAATIQTEKQKNAEIMRAQKQMTAMQKQDLAQMKAFGIGALAVTTAVVAGAVKAYGAYQDYAGSVRDLALVSGTSAEETSTLIQVLDDYQISAEDVTASTRFMTKQGLTPTIETIAMLSDQYRSLTTEQEKNAFVLKNLGRSGLQWVNVLNQGGDAILQNADDVNKWLVMTDEQIAAAEQSRLAVDSLSDTWEGAKVQTGAAIGAGIVYLDDYEKRYQKFEQWRRAIGVQDLAVSPDAFANFSDQLTRAQQMGAGWEKLLAQQGAAGPEPIDYAQQLSSGLQVSQMIDQQAQSTADLNQKLAEQQAILDQLAKQGYSPLGNKMQEQQRIVDSLKQAQTEQAQNYEQTADQMMLTMLETAGASDQMRLEYSKSSGLITEKAATQQAAMEEIAQALADGRINADEAAAAVSYMLEMLDNLDGKEVEATINLITNGNVPNIGNTPSGGGGQGGGGGASVYDPNRYDQMAGGGQLSAPLTEVGEQGPEFISSSGWVYTAAQTRAMKAAGIRPGRGLRIGGDLAGTGVFGTEGAPGYASAVNGGSNRRADAVVEIAQSIGSMQSTSALQTAAMQNTMTMYQQQAQKTNDLLTALVAKTATAGAIGQSVAINSVTYK